MKKILSATLALILGTTLFVGGAIPIAAEEIGPYNTIEGGCITNIKIEKNRLIDEARYFTAVVNSHVQGLDHLESIPYTTFGVIGTEDTKMFVYSIGSDDGLDFKRATVREIVEKFEAENPEWNALVAINGDFFDIETSKTSSMGEPESAMIQLGDVYKSYIIPSATGRGLVGTTADGEMVYYTVGDIYRSLGYGTELSYETDYALQFYGEDRTEVIAEYTAAPDYTPAAANIAFLTQDSEPQNLTGTTVFVVSCDTYRRAHVGINGAELGTHGYFFEGEIIYTRAGTENDRPREGEVYIATQMPERYEQLKVGSYVKGQKKPSGKWAEVENAIGFKAHILIEGDLFIKNAYSRNNQTGNEAETRKWTEDLYDYPHCNKDRTAIGFRDDGTPVLLVIKKSNHTGQYKNLGASYHEIAEQLKSLGCTNGFLLDGGGSTTLVIRKASGGFTTAYSGDGNGRAVANAVILAVRDNPEPEPDVEPDVVAPTEPNTDPGNTTEDPTTQPGDNTDASDDTSSSFLNDRIFKIAIPALVALAGACIVGGLLIKKRKKKKKAQ